MTFRIEIVDPLAAAEPASRVLRSAWKPPSLDYSPAYLAWQFGFPGAREPKVVIGFLDDRPAGCAAVTQRRFLFAGTHVDAYVLSFVAVDPIARGRGLAAAIYAKLLDALSGDIPVFAFAEPNTTGERVLLNAFAQASFKHHPLQPCRAAGYLQRPNAAGGTSCSAKAVGSYEEFTTVMPVEDGKTAWSAPTRQQWNHYMSDPRARVAIVIRDRGGRPIGSGMIVMTEILSAQGPQRVPMLESIYVPSDSPDGLLAAFRLASEQCEPSATIVASNLSYLDTTLIRAAGARALPSSFSAHLFSRTDQTPLELASRLNLEVI